FGREGKVARGGAAQQAEIKRRFYFEIFHIEPGGGAAQAGREQRRGRGEQGRSHAHDHLRAPAGMSEHDTRAAGGKAGQMEETGNAGGAGGNPCRASPDGDAIADLTAIGPAAVPGSHLPVRIERRRGDHAHVVAVGSKPLGHHAGVFASSGQFGMVIDAVDEDAHVVPAVEARSAVWKSRCSPRKWRRCQRSKLMTANKTAAWSWLPRRCSARKICR